MHLFFSVGEPSGDQHAAHLIRELRRRRPDLEFSGFGGPQMQRAGCRLLYRLTDLAVMFLASVIPELPKFYRLLQRAKRFFRNERPDAVVLVDFPGFNWHVARRAKAAGIPVFYYLPPQMWAWGSWRVKKMRKFVDHVLCGLPFEPDWYAERGVEAEYVGHPFFDEIAQHRLDADFCAGLKARGAKVLGILPGSRRKEVERNWPLMRDVMRKIHRRLPDVALPVAAYSEELRDRCRQLHAASGDGLPLQFHVGKTPEIIESADCCLMASGSVSLEMLARATPAAVVYRISRFATVLKWLFLNIEWISLPNLFAGRTVLPEWVFHGSPQPHVPAIVETLHTWLTNDSARSDTANELRHLRDRVFKTGAGRQTAEAILRHITSPLSEKRAA